MLLCQHNPSLNNVCELCFSTNAIPYGFLGFLITFTLNILSARGLTHSEGQRNVKNVTFRKTCCTRLKNQFISLRPKLLLSNVQKKVFLPCCEPVLFCAFGAQNRVQFAWAGMQAAGCQTIIHDFAGGYRSHVLDDAKWTIWHSKARQEAFPPHTDWRQALTQAYYMTANPWPLAILIHTICAPRKRQEPGWTSAPTLIWILHREEYLRATWHSNTIWTTDLPHLHAGPTTQARRAATPAVTQSGQGSPKWVVCIFSPANAPKITFCMTYCALWLSRH